MIDNRTGSTRIPQSSISSSLALVKATDADKDPTVFINAQSLWRPAWARGVYGGALIAQSIEAARQTLTPEFQIHTAQCQFIAAGMVDQPFQYRVNKLQDGRTFSMRMVRIIQNNRCIFTAVHGFARQPHKRQTATHSIAMPLAGSTPPLHPQHHQFAKASHIGPNSLFDCIRCSVVNQQPSPEMRKLHHWIRARGPIDQEDHNAHAVALAYMSDNYFIGTVARVRNATRFDALAVTDTLVTEVAPGEAQHNLRQYLNALAREERADGGEPMEAEMHKTHEDREHVQMMVTLNHTIYFHDTDAVDATEWMLAEMEAPWAGHERGLVMQRIWAQNGVLVATCVQEGVVRLSQERTGRSKI